jgi:glycosyltransferase involved in cell wall biosynthesis
MLRSVDVVLALSEGWAQQILAIEPAATVKVLANPVAIPDETSAGQLFMARLWPEKGVDELLQAVAALQGRFPHLQLVCAGDGDLDGVRRRAQVLGVAERLRLTGWIAGADKWREFRDAAVFVLPSWYEGLPIGVLEAMAAGVPVVASDVGAIGETLGGDAGLLCPARDVKALTTALARLLGDESLSRQLGVQGRRRACAQFSEHRVVKALGEIYRSLGLGTERPKRDGNQGCAE